jgi:hypothetical protein
VAEPVYTAAAMPRIRGRLMRRHAHLCTCGDRALGWWIDIRMLTRARMIFSVGVSDPNTLWGGLEKLAMRQSGDRHLKSRSAPETHECVVSRHEGSVVRWGRGVLALPEAGHRATGVSGRVRMKAVSAETDSQRRVRIHSAHCGIRSQGMVESQGPGLCSCLRSRCRPAEPGKRSPAQETHQGRVHASRVRSVRPLE